MKAAAFASVPALLWSSLAVAAPLRTLEVEASPKAACLQEESLREAVAERLGRDPFAPDSQTEAHLTVQVVVQERNRQLLATLLVDGARREFSASTTQCLDLRNAVALALAVLFEEDSASPTPTEPEPSAAPSPPTTRSPAAHHPSEPGADAPSPPTSPTASWFALAALTGHAARLPRPFVGALVGVGYERKRWSVALEGSFEPSVDRPGQSLHFGTFGTVSAALYTGAFVPCVRSWIFALCGRLSAGTMRSEAGGLANFSLTSNQQSQFFAAFGARFGAIVRLPASAPLDAFAALDTEAPMAGKTITLRDVELWRMPPVGFSARLGIRIRF